jgi:hypothetical protein
MAQVPDYVPIYRRGTLDIAGYVSKCDLHFCPEVRPGNGPSTVYGPDLRTVIGHDYPGKGFVPIGTDPANVPNFPVRCYDSKGEVPCSTGPPATPTQPAFSLPGGGFRVSTLPAGFAPFGNSTRRMAGPDPKVTLDGQSFLNASANQRINVSVVRGIRSDQELAQYSDVGRSVHSAKTGIADTATQERQLGWIVDASTVAFVTGSHVTDDALFAFAENVQVQP